MTAEIIATVPAEPPGFQTNNLAEHWLIADSGTTKYTNGDAGVRIPAISDPLPQAGGATTFTVVAFNHVGIIKAPTRTIRDTDSTQLDVQVRISLSPGLAFAATQQVPDGTTFNRNSGIWDVGEVGEAIADNVELPVAVNLTGNLADLPLEERCLTAEVVRAVPWWEFVPSKRDNDTVTTCLGEPEALLTQGETGLFHVLDCVGVTTYPCTDDDTLELVVERGGLYLQPEDVVVLVQDPQGRYGTKWRTGRTEHHDTSVADHPGVQATISYPRASKGYTVYTRAISDVSPKQRPGELTIWGNPQASFKLLDADTLATRPPANLSVNLTSKPYPLLLEFSTLGTYQLQLTIGATKSGTAYTATGVYTFQVGRAADLEVRDAGRSPEAGGSQRAYTIMAVNNGPNVAPAVEVRLTGVPQGAQAIPSQGSYSPGTCQNGLCAGEWIISELGTPDVNRSTGLPEGPTLTLVSAAGGDPVTATIESTEDYCVRIKTGAYFRGDLSGDQECVGDLPTGYTEHTAAYYDFPDDNNTATVQARPGTATGEAAAGAPRSLVLQPFGAGALLRWEPVERVNGFAVTHYHVKRSGVTVADDVMENTYVDLEGGVNRPYRVRAVNEFGVPGPWSSPAGTAGSLDLTAAAAYGEGRIDLFWLPPSTSDSLLYRIEHSRDGRSWQVLVDSHRGTTYSHDNLPRETAHYYRVTASAGIVTIAQAWTVEVTDPPAVEVVGRVPAPPQNLRFSSLERTSVTLVWDPPADGTVTGYEYQVLGPCAGGGDGCLVVAPSRVDGTSRRISGLDLEGTYEFRVRALNDAGAGDWSWAVQKTVAPAAAGGGRVILSPAALTVPEGGEATYRVKLSREPTQPLVVVLFWDGDPDLGADLPSQQFKVLLPGGYDTTGLAGVSCQFPDLFSGGWTYAWNVGVPITVRATEDTDTENGRLIIEHDINTVPADCLGNPAGYAPDPVYDGMFGIALEVTERDNDG